MQRQSLLNAFKNKKYHRNTRKLNDIKSYLILLNTFDRKIRNAIQDHKNTAGIFESFQSRFGNIASLFQILISASEENSSYFPYGIFSAITYNLYLTTHPHVIEYSEKIAPLIEQDDINSVNERMFMHFPSLTPTPN